MRDIPRRLPQARNANSANQSKVRRSVGTPSGVNPSSSPGSISDSAANKASLSPARRRLLEILQKINFGRIENLSIRDGEPVLDPLPSIHREIKFGGESGPRPELGTADCCLKEQHVQLFDVFDQLQNGVIATLEVQNGLPVSGSRKGVQV